MFRRPRRRSLNSSRGGSDPSPLLFVETVAVWILHPLIWVCRLSTSPAHFPFPVALALAKEVVVFCRLGSDEAPPSVPAGKILEVFAGAVSGWCRGQARAPCLHSPADKGRRVKGERLSDIWGQPPWPSSKASSLRSPPQRERKFPVLTGRDCF